MADIVKLLTDFEVTEEFACFRLSGQHTFRKVIEMIKDAIHYSREQKIPKLLVDTTGVWGFPPTSFIERFSMGEAIADEATGAVMVALVASPEFLDPGKFGSVIAQHRGLVMDVFESKEKAAEWLAAL